MTTEVTVRVVNDDGTLRSYDEIELDVLQIAFLRCNGNVVAMSKDLRVARSTLYRWLHRCPWWSPMVSSHPWWRPK